MPRPDESDRQLAYRFLAGGTSPSRRLSRQESRERVWSALTELGPRDREVLVMRHLEPMETPEIAAALEISEGPCGTADSALWCDSAACGRGTSHEHRNAFAGSEGFGRLRPGRPRR
jgi:hypothetical protein